MDNTIFSLTSGLMLQQEGQNGPLTLTKLILNEIKQQHVNSALALDL